MNAGRDLRTLSVSEVCERTGFTRARVYRLVRARRLAAIRLADRGHMRILASSLEALFDEAERSTLARPGRKQMLDDVDAAVLPTDRPRVFA